MLKSRQTKKGLALYSILLLFDRTGMLFDTKVPFYDCATVKLFVTERYGHKIVHVLVDRSEMHIQLLDMCKDNVFFKLPQCLNGLIFMAFPYLELMLSPLV